MFKVTSKQIEAFADVAVSTFPERLLAFLQRELPDERAEITQPAVDRAIAHAHRWGLRDELDVATFAVLTFTEGEAFDEQPWAREILVLPGVPASTRAHRVYEAAIRRRLVEGTALAKKEQP